MLKGQGLTVCPVMPPSFPAAQTLASQLYPGPPPSPPFSPFRCTKDTGGPCHTPDCVCPCDLLGLQVSELHEE